MQVSMNVVAPATAGHAEGTGVIDNVIAVNSCSGSVRMVLGFWGVIPGQLRGYFARVLRGYR